MKNVAKARKSRAVVKIEGRLDEFDKLNDRVNKLELWHAWLKGLWAALAAGYAWMFRDACGR